MSIYRELANRIWKSETRAPEFMQGQLTPWGDWNLATASASGAHVTVNSTQQLLAVYGCVQLISGTISTLPRHIQREQDGTEVATKPKWFLKPNPFTTMAEFLSQTVTSLLLNGNAYWVYGLDGNLMPNEIYVLDPACVAVKQKAGPGVSPVISYEVDGKPFRGHLMHLKGICSPGSPIGISPIEAAKQSIGVGLAAQEFAARFYSNGATLGQVIKMPGPMTKDQAKEAVRKFSDGHAGLANAHKPGLIDQGGTIETIGVPPEQAQFLQSRQFQAAEICSQMFLVDPAWFGMALGTGSNVTYSNLESQGVRLATFTLTRWLVTIEQAFYELLPRPQEFRFNLDGLKRGDLAARADYYTKAHGVWMDTQEIRDLEDLGPASADLKKTQAPVPQPNTSGLAVVPDPKLANG